MKTQKNYRYEMREGDSCNVRSKESGEQLRIEDHPQKLLENQTVEAAPAAMAAAPVKKKSGVFGWCLAGLVALLLIGGFIYFTGRGDEYASRGDKVAGMVVKKPVKKVTVVRPAAAAADAVDYVYYFANDKSAVTDNAVLDQVASKVGKSGADVVVTAYASEVGNPAYNMKLSARRAENIAGYLIAHGVPRDHVKIVSNGESDKYGDFAHNRRANIHIEYNS